MLQFANKINEITNNQTGSKMKLSNPCPVSDILLYAQTMPFNDDNEYISKIHDEILVEKVIINGVFQLTQHYAGKQYIDIGCVILSFATLAKSKYANVYIDLMNGAISIPDNFKDTESLELDKIQELTNSLKQIIIEIFSPTMTD